jgi:hypothetical protein
VNFKKSAQGFQTYRVYFNPETSFIEVQATYTGDTVVKVAVTADYFASHPFISLLTEEVQTINVRSLYVGTVNEYRMTQQVPWLKKRDEWKLGAGVTRFEWESDNRDCYFVVHPNNAWPINAGAGAWVIFYGWDNTLSMILRGGGEVTRNGHRLPEFRLGLFYSYAVTIDANTGILTAESSAGL